MNQYDSEEIWILNPDYDIRPDADRYLLFSKLFRYNDSENIKSFVHPIHAWILSIFSEGCKLSEAYKTISSELDLTEQEVTDLIGSWLGNEKSVCLDVEGNIVVIPKNILIPKKSINKETPAPRKIVIEKPTEINSVDLATRRHQVPFILTFMLTNKCLTNCCYCYADTQTRVEKKLSVDRILQIIRQAKEIGVQNIELIGGEVLLHQKWWVILKALLDNGFCPDIISTKVPINNKIINHFKEINYPGTLQLSIDTFNEEIATKTLKCYKGYINDIIEGITLLENNRIRYKLETVLTKSTASIENIDIIYSHIKNSDSIVSWEIREAMFSQHKSSNNFSDIKATPEQLDVVFSYIENTIQKDAHFAIKSARSETTKNFYEVEDGCMSFSRPACSALNHHVFILPDGKCTICEQLYWNPRFIIGDISEEDILDVWNSSRSKALLNIKQQNLNRKSACHGCSLFEGCYKIYRNRCWSDIIKAYGVDNWDFPDPLCKFAPKVMNDIGY